MQPCRVDVPPFLVRRRPQSREGGHRQEHSRYLRTSGAEEGVPEIVQTRGPPRYARARSQVLVLSSLCHLIYSFASISHLPGRGRSAERVAGGCWRCPPLGIMLNGTRRPLQGWDDPPPRSSSSCLAFLDLSRLGWECDEHDENSLWKMYMRKHMFLFYQFTTQGFTDLGHQSVFLGP